MSQDTTMAAPAPRISLIIPTRNRRAQVQQCLTSLVGQAYPRDRWEVIVVIDGDDDALGEGLAEWGGRLPLRWFRQPHAGCGIARNTGAAQARGLYLVFTDDDCLFPPDWLSRYAEQFQRNGDCVVAGRSANALPHNAYSQATQELMDYLLSRFNSCAEDATLAIGNNFGVPAEGFRALGGFSARYFRMAAEDRDFCSRWRKQGKRIVYAPDVVVHHAHVLTLASFLRQHFHYGRGAWLFHRLEARRWRSHRGIEAPGFYLSLLLWPWTVRKGFSAVRLSALLVLSQAAQTAGYFCGFLAKAKAPDCGSVVII